MFWHRFWKSGRTQNTIYVENTKKNEKVMIFINQANDCCVKENIYYAFFYFHNPNRILKLNDSYAKQILHIDYERRGESNKKVTQE